MSNKIFGVEEIIVQYENRTKKIKTKNKQTNKQTKTQQLALDVAISKELE